MFYNEQLSMFSVDVSEDTIVETKNGYILVQLDNEADDTFVYKIVSEDNKEELVDGEFKSKISALDLSTSDYQASKIRAIFLRKVWQEKSRKRDEAEAKKASDSAIKKVSSSRYTPGGAFDTPSSGRSLSTRSNYWGNYTYTPPKKSTGFLDKLNKSDTLVIHCEDRSTDMLSQIYNGKGWDVLRDGNIDKDELHQLLESHSRIVCLGHGTGGGLINCQGGGSTIGSEEAPYLKDKHLFVIWCNADRYFETHGIGNGQFITGNMPSEVWECSGAGCGEISSQLMLENITYWSKLCAEVVDQALSGDAAGAVKHVQDKYIEKYGDHPVTIYNAERTKVQGEPIVSMFDRYWGDMALMAKARYFSKEYQEWVKSNLQKAADEEAQAQKIETNNKETTNIDQVDTTNADSDPVEEAFTGDVSEIDVNKIQPTQKDFDRAEDLKFTQSYVGAYKSTFHGSGSPWTREAEKMAKLITDPIKLVRRAKAVLAVYGLRYEDDSETAVWGPFKYRLIKLGFTNTQINDILKSR